LAAQKGFSWSFVNAKPLRGASLTVGSIDEKGKLRACERFLETIKTDDCFYNLFLFDSIADTFA
jgi:hypothetical protein